MPPEENILVVERSLLDELGSFQGIQLDVASYLPVLLDQKNTRYVPREGAETDPSLKQLIPYFIIIHDNKIWRYVRGKKSGESRLVANASIGIGGHINDEDHDLFGDVYRRGAERELNEEMLMPEGCEDRVVALLNDDSNEVGQVHLGVVHILKAPSGDVRKRESVITESGFVTRDDLLSGYEQLETWSQLCVDQLDALLAAYDA